MTGRLVALKLAWLAVARRKRRTIISVLLLAFVLSSSITIGSTIRQFPLWVSALSSSSPGVLLAYERNSPVVGLIPVNSTIPLSDSAELQGISGVEGVTPLILKDLPTTLSPNPSLVVGLDINFWQLSLGLNSGHWPEPNTSEAVVSVASASASVPSTITIQKHAFQVVGVAVTADLVLANAIVISYDTAQKLFSLEGSTSVYVIQIASNADPAVVASEISKVDSGLGTIDLSATSGQILSTVTKTIRAISSTVVLVDGVFTFAILATLTMSSINSRRWEYGLVSTYGSRSSSLRMILLENWLTFALAVLPALALGIGVLAFFTYYFNALFGTNITALTAATSATESIFNTTTLLNYIAAFLAAGLGGLVATRAVLPKLQSSLLSEPHQ
jgi:hypothetical protein